MDVLRARGNVKTCQLTVAGSMSRSCERRFLFVLDAHLILCVALLVLLNLCIIDTFMVASCYQVQLYHHYTNRRSWSMSCPPPFVTTVVSIRCRVFLDGMHLLGGSAAAYFSAVLHSLGGDAAALLFSAIAFIRGAR